MGKKSEGKWVVWGGGLEGRTREREGVSHEGGNCERGNKKRIEGTGVIRKSVL